MPRGAGHTSGRQRLSAGTVYEDPDADGNIGDGVARPGVTVNFYRDDGDDQPDAGDTFEGFRSQRRGWCVQHRPA